MVTPAFCVRVSLIRQEKTVGGRGCLEEPGGSSRADSSSVTVAIVCEPLVTGGFFIQTKKFVCKIIHPSGSDAPNLRLSLFH